MGILDMVTSAFASGYADLMNLLPSEYASLLNLLIFSVLISLYSIFTWYFYRSLSKKDLLQLDLRRYNRSSHPFFRKFIASVLYLLEYVIILPFLIFFWLAVLAIIVLVLSEQQTAGHVLIIAAAMVASVRILSYYQEELSRDLAKLFPLTILSIFVLTPNFFSFPRMIEGLLQIKEFSFHLVYFLGFIIVLEFILRIFDFITNNFSEKNVSEEN